MSYDVKFHLRALEYWNDGHSRKEAAEVFKVSPYTLQLWKSQLKEASNLEPKKRRETWRKIEPTKLAAYLEQHYYTSESYNHIVCSGWSRLPCESCPTRSSVNTRRCAELWSRRSDIGMVRTG